MAITRNDGTNGTFAGYAQFSDFKINNWSLNKARNATAADGPAPNEVRSLANYVQQLANHGPI